MKRLALIALAAGALAIAAAGCGGGGELTKEEYEQKVAAIGQSLEPAFEELVVNVQALAPESISSLDDLDGLFAEMADEIHGLEDGIDAAASDLEELNPPDEVAEAQDTLVRALKLTADEFGEFADAVSAGDLTNIQSIAATFQDFGALEAGKLFEQAVELYQAAGYEVSPE